MPSPPQKISAIGGRSAIPLQASAFHDRFHRPTIANIIDPITSDHSKIPTKKKLTLTRLRSSSYLLNVYPICKINIHYHKKRQPFRLPSHLHFYRFWKNKRMTSKPPITLPAAVPRLVNTTTNKTRVTLLSQNPLRVKTSFDRVWKSPTFGRRT